MVKVLEKLGRILENHRIKKSRAIAEQRIRELITPYWIDSISYLGEEPVSWSELSYGSEETQSWQDRHEVRNWCLGDFEKFLAKIIPQTGDFGGILALDRIVPIAWDIFSQDSHHEIYQWYESPRDIKETRYYSDSYSDTRDYSAICKKYSAPQFNIRLFWDRNESGIYARAIEEKLGLNLGFIQSNMHVLEGDWR
jgi:hypothetical protein